ncbi:putative sugar phosphate/phosphate translocator [Tetrabaena socialis]|uniref:Putative sugar phosphate/phosphate translocator n=1 Tax=Tetrabaena socialis TaxID=47790 RepID=A0A2J7ZUL1_9CHLO|nr:putative sugar phosphate/phosphate translocator [Tetrabaena socialis]|eukprot:PNH03966.1 putative sugar phosphate/phosphate translocator [Tetrabaena socialis]
MAAAPPAGRQAAVLAAAPPLSAGKQSRLGRASRSNGRSNGSCQRAGRSKRKDSRRPAAARSRISFRCSFPIGRVATGARCGSLQLWHRPQHGCPPAGPLKANLQPHKMQMPQGQALLPKRALQDASVARSDGGSGAAESELAVARRDAQAGDVHSGSHSSVGAVELAESRFVEAVSGEAFGGLPGCAVPPRAAAVLYGPDENGDSSVRLRGDSGLHSGMGDEAGRASRADGPDTAGGIPEGAAHSAGSFAGGTGGGVVSGQHASHGGAGNRGRGSNGGGGGGGRDGGPWQDRRVYDMQGGAGLGAHLPDVAATRPRAAAAVMGRSSRGMQVLPGAADARPALEVRDVLVRRRVPTAFFAATTSRRSQGSRGGLQQRARRRSKGAWGSDDDNSRTSSPSSSRTFARSRSRSHSRHRTTSPSRSPLRSARRAVGWPPPPPLRDTAEPQRSAPGMQFNRARRFSQGEAYGRGHGGRGSPMAPLALDAAYHAVLPRTSAALISRSARRLDWLPTHAPPQPLRPLQQRQQQQRRSRPEALPAEGGTGSEGAGAKRGRATSTEPPATGAGADSGGAAGAQPRRQRRRWQRREAGAAGAGGPRAADDDAAAGGEAGGQAVEEAMAPLEGLAAAQDAVRPRLPGGSFAPRSVRAEMAGQLQERRERQLQKALALRALLAGGQPQEQLWPAVAAQLRRERLRELGSRRRQQGQLQQQQELQGRGAEKGSHEGSEALGASGAEEGPGAGAVYSGAGMGAASSDTATRRERRSGRNASDGGGAHKVRRRRQQQQQHVHQLAHAAEEARAAGLQPLPLPMPMPRRGASAALSPERPPHFLASTHRALAALMAAHPLDGSPGAGAPEHRASGLTPSYALVEKSTMLAKDPATQAKVVREVIRSYSYVLLWMCVSCGVIMFNKWLLAYSGFPFPIALTLWHMFFCSFVGVLAVRVFKVVKSHNMTPRDYYTRVMPIGT